MQDDFPLTWMGWKQLVLGIVATLITGGGIHRLVSIWLNRKKPAAETQKITIETRVTEGDAVARWMHRLEEAQTNIDRLRHERDKWMDQYDIVFVQRDELVKENGLLKTENKAYAQQIDKMHATLKMHGLNYDDTKRPE